mmetsp:Transcript_28569/g.40715  ORF Transcript_28569/g.40715 Transcript_28569/m.40715 type:complete len:120 (-) Transcript_28569:113-472(-)
MKALTAAEISVIVTNFVAPKEGPLRRLSTFGASKAGDASSRPSSYSSMGAASQLWLPQDVFDASFLLTNLSHSEDDKLADASLADLLRLNTVIDAHVISCPPYFNMLQQEVCRLVIPKL